MRQIPLINVREKFRDYFQVLFFCVITWDDQTIPAAHLVHLLLQPCGLVWHSARNWLQGGVEPNFSDWSQNGRRIFPLWLKLIQKDGIISYKVPSAFCQKFLIHETGVRQKIRTKLKPRKHILLAADIVRFRLESKSVNHIVYLLRRRDGVKLIHLIDSTLLSDIAMIIFC